MLPTLLPPPPDQLVVRALNALLEREPWARDRLARHAGKTVRFVAGRISLNLTINAAGAAELADAAVVPDVTLTVRMADLSPLAWLAQRVVPSSDADGLHRAMTDLTHIEGDAGLGQVVGELAQHLRWDVEDELARVLGDVPAARLMGAARAATGGLRRAGERLAANIAEYLSEEREVIAASPLLAAFHSDNQRAAAEADTLAARLARLDARLSRLTANRS